MRIAARIILSNISILFLRRRLLLFMLGLTVSGGCLLPMTDGVHLYNGRFSRDILFFLLNLQGLILCIVHSLTLSENAGEENPAGSYRTALLEAAAAVCIQTLLAGMTGIGLLWLLTGAQPHGASAGLLLLACQFAILSSLYTAARSRFHQMTALLLLILALVLGYGPDLPGLDSSGSWLKTFLTFPIPDLSFFNARDCLVFEWQPGMLHIVNSILYSFILCLFYFSLSLPSRRTDGS